MEKIVIILIVLINISILNADIIGDVEPYVVPHYEGRTNIVPAHFNGLLQPTIEYSQEDYIVGDIIDITIHFEVNTAENFDNQKFAVTDYKNRSFYGYDLKQTDEYTQDEMEIGRSDVYRNPVYPLIESDPDLILSNDQPKGEYHIKFKLEKKIYRDNQNGDYSPYIFTTISVYSFTKAEKHKYLTDYGRSISSFRIPIKINPASLKNENPPTIYEMENNPVELPERKPLKIPANKLEG